MNKELADKVEQVCSSWNGTRWIENGRWKQRGVDCVNFVDAVLEELYKLPPRRFETFQRFSSFHDHQFVNKNASLIAHRYPCEVVDEPANLEEYEAGDVIVLRLGNGKGPGHVVMIGGSMNIWDSSCPEGVKSVPIGSLKSSKILKIWRLKEKEKWLSSSSQP